MLNNLQYVNKIDCSDIGSTYKASFKLETLETLVEDLKEKE